MEDLERRLSIEAESKRLEVQRKELELKKLGVQKRRDYSKLSVEELQKQYNLAKTRGDSTGVQLIAFEFKKRGIFKEAR